MNNLKGNADQEEKHIREAFKIIDKDGNGFIRYFHVLTKNMEYLFIYCNFWKEIPLIPTCSM